MASAVSRSGQAADSASHLHAVNQRIRELAALSPDADFVCECGCFQFVRFTIERYDALDDGPVYVDGHPLRPAA
jgi:hypothetical protein